MKKVAAVQNNHTFTEQRDLIGYPVMFRQS